MRRVLITGASGFIGSNLAISLRKKYDVYGTYFKNKIFLKGCHMFQMDILNKLDVTRLITSVNPNIIIHCLAMADIDECQKNEKGAVGINIIGTENLCRLAAPMGIQVIYLSTDQIYDNPGSVDRMIHEHSLIKPLNIYSTSKLKGEEKVKELCINYQIIRLALCYGLSGGSNSCFTDELNEKFKKRKQVQVYTNQFRTPVLVDDVCVGIEKIIEDSPPNETYNLGGAQIINRADFAKLYCMVFNFNKNLLDPVVYTKFSGKANRVLVSSLDSSKFINRFKYTPLGPEEGIKKLYLQKMMIIPST